MNLLKKTIILLTFFSQAVFSAYQSESVLPLKGLDLFIAGSETNLDPDPSLFADISQVTLSYKGEPLCVANTVKYPSLVPVFWQVTTRPTTSTHKANSMGMVTSDSVNDPAGGDILPECGVEEMNRIYQMTQNAILIDEQNSGIQVAGAPIVLTILCVGAFTVGQGVYMFNKHKDAPVFKAFYMAIAGGVSASGFSEAIFEKPKTSFPKAGALAGVCGVAGYTLMYNIYED